MARALEGRGLWLGRGLAVGRGLGRGRLSCSWGADSFTPAGRLVEGGASVNPPLALLQQVQEKWHLVEDLSRLLPESPHSLSPRPRSFCPGFPCPGSPAPRPSGSERPPADPACRFRFPSGADQ